MQNFEGIIRKDQIQNTKFEFAGDLYEDDAWEFDNAQIIPRQYFEKHYKINKCKSFLNFNGSYMFVYPLEDSVFIGTDQNSIHPLYYTEYEDALYYSWNLDRLLEMFPLDPGFNWNNLFSWLLVGPAYYNDETRFKGIRRLEAGQGIIYNCDGINLSAPEPARYRPDYFLSYEDHLHNVKDKLSLSIQRRVRMGKVINKPILMSLSGGLDSRIILAEVVKHYGSIICYTYGEKDFEEKTIAKQVADYYGLKHIDINIDRQNYIDNARNEANISGGMSLFKHMPQYVFSKELRNLEPFGVMFGSALDLLLGNSYPVIKYESNDKILSLFQEHWKYHEYENPIDRIKDYGSDFDVSCTHHIDTRVKRWYNRNLIYHLMNHRLLLPTYDNDFLEAVYAVPWEYRKDDNFRVDLLKLIDYGVSKINYNVTGQPAYIKSPYLGLFKKHKAVINTIKHDLWIKEKIYLPSNTCDFNMLEWLRVYPEYQKFVREVLLSDDSILIKEYFDSREIERLIDRHIDGKENNHKEITMLVSAELCCQHYLKGEKDES